MSAGASRGERMTGAVAAVVIAYAALAALWFMRQQDEWKMARKLYDGARATYASECRLIKNKSAWEERYEEERSKLRTFRAGRDTDTEWMRTIYSLAETNHVHIGNHSPGAEKKAGDVMELPVEVKDWDGALESLVRFMYDVETTESGMFDFDNLNIKPGKNGYFRGGFTLMCAYMRGKEDDEDGAEGAGGKK